MVTARSARAAVPTGEVHPAAAVWPMLAEADLRRLAEDIAANGLLYPVILDADGRVLDGRNRLAACGIAGVEPRFETYDGDPVARVLSANNERRHMTTGQRAMATALTLAADGRRVNGRWKRGSVPINDESVNSGWQQRMKEAGMVLDHSPDLAARVTAGDMPLSAAYDQADAVRRRAERIAGLGGELAALVGSGVITVAEAERRADEAARVAELADDLAERVRAGNLAIGEAETIAAERERRLAAVAERVRGALDTLTRMVGYPLTADLLARLNGDEARQLKIFLTAMEGDPPQ